MKRLIALSFGLFLIGLSIATANPAPLLLTLPKSPSQLVVLKLSDADLSAITSFAANNQAALIASLVNGLDIANDIMVQPNVKNKIPMPKLKVGNGFRPYSGLQEFKVKGLTYSDRFLEVKVGKRELQIDPEDYRGTYLAWLNSPGSSAAKKDIPFAQFMWGQVILNMQREMNDETAYHGFDSSAVEDFDVLETYAAATFDKVKFATATDNPNAVKDYWMCIDDTLAGESPDTDPDKWQNVTARAVAPGIESYILAGIDDTSIAPVTTGAITNGAGVAIAAFKKLFRAFGPAYKNNGIITSCSYTDWELLMDDLGDKYKALRNDASENGYLVLPETNKKGIVKPATWLGTSRRLIAGPYMPGDPTRHTNLYMGTDLLSDSSQISVKDTELWKLNAGLKVCMGFQIQDIEAIKVGDQV